MLAGSKSLDLSSLHGSGLSVAGASRRHRGEEETVLAIGSERTCRRAAVEENMGGASGKGSDANEVAKPSLMSEESAGAMQTQHQQQLPCNTPSLFTFHVTGPEGISTTLPSIRVSEQQQPREPRFPLPDRQCAPLHRPQLAHCEQAALKVSASVERTFSTVIDTCHPLHPTSSPVTCKQESSWENTDITSPDDRPSGKPKMGNQHSHLVDSRESSAIDDQDAISVNSVLRASRTKASRAPRRSSINVFKRLDTKSPQPHDLTTAALEVPRAATAPNLDGADDEGDASEADAIPPPKASSYARHMQRRSAPSPSLPIEPASPAATLTEERAARPISASGTITRHTKGKSDDSTGTGHQSHNQDEDIAEDEESSPGPPRVSALSPTLPTPSPIPEDSPHKYGLRDRLDTPEADMHDNDLNVNKARRRSSGLAIFNEAKTLQSASSFLNGLSTARRRAESRAQSRNGTDNSQLTASTSGTIATYTSANPSFPHLPLSATSSTIHPYSSISAAHLPTRDLEADLDLDVDFTNRQTGHCFKASGVAYAPPLSLIQLKCYTSHSRLLPSRNKYAPVECAVCHADENAGGHGRRASVGGESTHDSALMFWSCSWCALRMCSICRRELQGSGVMGLRERVRMAEMGAY